MTPDKFNDLVQANPNQIPVFFLTSIPEWIDEDAKMVKGDYLYYTGDGLFRHGRNRKDYTIGYENIEFFDYSDVMPSHAPYDTDELQDEIMSKSPQQAFVFYPGKYYVEYKPTKRHPERCRSRCMTYWTAKEYANIFGGSVHRDPRFPTLTQSITKWCCDELDRWRGIK